MQYANVTDISADVANSSPDINASIILVSVIDYMDVPMLLKYMADIGRYQSYYTIWCISSVHTTPNGIIMELWGASFITPFNTVCTLHFYSDT